MGRATEAVESRPEPGLIPVSLVRAHGGAGGTTLARLLDPVRSGVVVEAPPGGRLPQGHLPLLVARSTAMGTRAVAEMLAGWPAGLPRPGLVVIADTPWREAKVVRYRLHALSSQVVGTVRVPYLLELRSVDDPAVALRKKRVAKVVEQVRSQLQELASVAGR